MSLLFSAELKCSSDTVALLGQLTNFTFTYNIGQVFEGVVDCGGSGLIIGHMPGTDQQLKDRSISWYQEAGKFTIQILATVENNNTEVYGILDMIEKTAILRLTVVASKFEQMLATAGIYTMVLQVHQALL